MHVIVLKKIYYYDYYYCDIFFLAYKRLLLFYETLLARKLECLSLSNKCKNKIPNYKNCRRFLNGHTRLFTLKNVFKIGSFDFGQLFLGSQRRKLGVYSLVFHLFQRSFGYLQNIVDACSCCGNKMVGE